MIDQIYQIYWEMKRKDCLGCAWDHPSQRRHECLMDTSNNHIYWKMQLTQHMLQI